MSKISTFVVFTVGAGLGVAATWFYVKKKYEQLAQEEIESVKEVFSQREAEPDIKRETANRAKEKPGIAEYAAGLNKLGYTNYSDVKPKEEPKNMDSPYVISPEEFGEFEDYEKISLTYYADKKLADDEDVLVDDVDGVVATALLGECTLSR